MISRRRFFVGSAVLAAAPLSGWPPSPAEAEAPAKRPGQAPGYFRLLVGDIEVTALFDGAGAVNPTILHGATPDVLAALLEDACIDPKAEAPIAINTFLINTGRNLILVDTGAGAYFGPRAGMLPGNLRAAGYAPDQVDTVVLTHLHADHALGLADADGRMVFPAATVRVHEADAAYWQSNDRLANAPEKLRKNLTALRAALAPYIAAGKFSPLGPGEAPAPGVEAVPLPGHTPGHCGFRVSDKGQSLLAWGDTIHNAAVQFPRPDVSIDFDVDQPKAVATRQRLMAGLAKEQCVIAGAHLPFPGLGRVRPRPQGYAWVPVEYGVPKAG